MQLDVKNAVEKVAWDLCAVIANVCGIDSNDCLTLHRIYNSGNADMDAELSILASRILNGMHPWEDLKFGDELMRFISKVDHED